MKGNLCYVIGLMSGTSLDGLDLVYVKFDLGNYSNFEIIHADTVPYDKEWKKTLQEAVGFTEDTLKKLDVDYGMLLADVVLDFVEKNAIDTIDFIASHGHTVLHQPEKGITLQVGDGQVLATKTGCKVVCDFRTQDVLLGGQGAPLVPIGDALLFAEYDFCLNLGGFSNVSFQRNNKRIAFDICPVNIVLNFYANKLGLAYDDAGKNASKGTVNTLLLKELNALDFYQEAPPKSLGLEWVKAIVFPLIDRLETDVFSVLRTFVEHAAIQIAKVIDGGNAVLVTGGGAFHTFLMERIGYRSNVKMKLSNTILINYKEALIFAFLAVLRVGNQVNCLQSVTGASRDHSSGVVFYPQQLKN